MTTPYGSPPDQAWVRGGGEWRYGQDLTEASAKSIMNGGVQGSYGGARQIYENDVKAPITGYAGSITNHETRIVALEDGGIMTVYSGNDTWTNIGGRIGVAVINGGQAGQAGSGSSSQKLGGTHGGYAYQEFNAADLDATVAITVGAPGTSAGQAGGVSSFGSYLVGAAGTIGAILTSRGAVSSSSAPGAGGNNGGAFASNGLPGGATALAAGGTGGADGSSGGQAAGDGTNGGSVSTASLTPCGGGGGGAGGGDVGIFGSGGDGGNGGSPGGGGGAGGNCDGGSAGTFGVGGSGRVYVIQSAGA